eukprot:TRINITY_DN11683_c0_g5_i1.p1 TRINITY_DN11683_c0_g5~~TRINITY_DN11683_c0_g5_i1.p1  ORF type:complete len:1066 (-),score=222.97 TRINITY_DN11683_c0_g5_i1:486-3299(-)
MTRSESGLDNTELQEEQQREVQESSGLAKSSRVATHFQDVSSADLQAHLKRGQPMKGEGQKDGASAEVCEDSGPSPADAQEVDQPEKSICNDAAVQASDQASARASVGVNTDNTYCTDASAATAEKDQAPTEQKSAGNVGRVQFDLSGFQRVLPLERGDVRKHTIKEEEQTEADDTHNGSIRAARAAEGRRRRREDGKGSLTTDTTFCDAINLPELREALIRTADDLENGCSGEQELLIAIQSIENSSRGWQGLGFRLQLVDELLDAGSAETKVEEEAKGPKADEAKSKQEVDNERFKQDEEVGHSWRQLAAIASGLSGHVSELAEAAQSVDASLLRSVAVEAKPVPTSQCLAREVDPPGPASQIGSCSAEELKSRKRAMDALLQQAAIHGGAGPLQRKLDKLGSLDAAIKLLGEMGLVTPEEKRQNKKGFQSWKKDSDPDGKRPKALSWVAKVVESWEAAIKQVQDEGGPEKFLGSCAQLGPLWDLQGIAVHLPKLRSLLGENAAEELAQLIERISEAGNVCCFVWQLQGCSVDRFQQHSFALDLLKKSLEHQGEELWGLMEDKESLQQFFSSINQVGGIKAFMHAITDIDMRLFAKHMTTVKLLELDVTSGATDAGATEPQQLLSRIQATGGLKAFLELTESLDMSRLGEYVRVLSACGLCKQGGENSNKTESAARWAMVARRLRQEDRGCELYLELFGTTKNEPEALTLRAVRRCTAVLKDLGLISSEGKTKKLEEFASALHNVELSELLELISSVGGFLCFREGVLLLRSFRLGDLGESEAMRLARLWLELTYEIQHLRGIEAFMSHLQSLRKLTSLCRYCRNASTGMNPAVVATIGVEDSPLSPSGIGLVLPAVDEEASPNGYTGVHIPTSPGSFSLSPKRKALHGRSPLSQRGLPELGSPSGHLSRGGVPRSVSMPVLRQAMEDKELAPWR